MSRSSAVVSRALRAAMAVALLHGAALADAPATDAPAAAPAAATAVPESPPAAEASAPTAPAASDALPTVVSDKPAIGRRRHVLGLMLDAGVPDVTAVSVLYRPWSYVRFNGGLMYNLAGYGLRAGASVQPYFPIAPSLNFDVGHYFGGNLYKRIGSFTTVDENLKPALSDVGYTFVNASVGLELGHPDWFVFFLRGGISRVWLDVNNANKSLPTPKQNDAYLSELTGPKGWLGIPNVKAGFMLFFY